MKKAKAEWRDWLRHEYMRSDFGTLVRGKYVRKLRAATNVVVLDPQVARAFPNDEAVNRALRELIRLAQSSSRQRKRAARRRTKTSPAA
jgi:hypothetical protein